MITTKKPQAFACGGNFVLSVYLLYGQSVGVKDIEISVDEGCSDAVKVVADLTAEYLEQTAGLVKAKQNILTLA